MVGFGFGFGSGSVSKLFNLLFGVFHARLILPLLQSPALRPFVSKIPVKPYRTPPSSNIQSSATQKCCGVVFFFCFSVLSVEKFVILRVKYYPLLLHLQKCNTPNFEFVTGIDCC